MQTLKATGSNKDLTESEYYAVIADLLESEEVQNLKNFQMSTSCLAPFQSKYRIQVTTNMTKQVAKPTPKSTMRYSNQ